MGVPVPSGPSCEIRNWVISRPGRYASGREVTPEECQAVVRNFNLLSAGRRPHLVLPLCLGHDHEQSLVRSLGWPCAGRVTAARLTGAGEVEIDVQGIPLAVGREANSGRYHSGSAGLWVDYDIPSLQDLGASGPILAHVSLLGIESPRVGGQSIPPAVFAGGYEVGGDGGPWWDADEPGRELDSWWIARAHDLHPR